MERWRRFAEKYRYSLKRIQIIALAPELEWAIQGPLPYLTNAKDYRLQILKIMRRHPDFSSELAVLESKWSKDHQRQINRLIWSAAGKFFPVEMEIFLESKSLVLAEFLDAMVKRRDFSNNTYNDYVDVIVRQVYGKVPEKYREFAYECAGNGLSKKHLEESIEIVEKGPKKLSYIPEVKLDGSLIGLEGYQFEKMSSTDPMMFILGKKTFCCQSIDGHSRDCVLHGALSPFGAFVKIMKPESKDPWVAQSWTALTEDNEIIFDSIEYNQGNDTKAILDLYALAATSMLLQNPRIKRVLIGGTGNTPKDHSYPLQVKPEKGYSRIIGYKDAGYDSKISRYIIAEQGHLHPAYVEILKEQPKQPMDDIVIHPGTDSYMIPGKTARGLSMNGVARRDFFDQHPLTEDLLRRNELNPLLEEGFYGSERERYGEYFLTFEAVEHLVDLKIRPQIKHVYLYNNDLNSLYSTLQGIRLAEGEHILLGAFTGIHASAAYIERMDGQLYGVIVDPEYPTEDSPLSHTIRSAYAEIRIRTTQEKLQVDYFSCTTFLIKSLLYFAKHGRELILSMEKGATPSGLLKMAQKLDFAQLDQERLHEVVSVKKNLTLAQYIQQHRMEIGGVYWNAAAIRKKYGYFDRLESYLSTR